MKSISSKFVYMLVAILCLSISSYGQTNKLEKRIYLFDITASMQGNGKGGTENIFEEVKLNLINAIKAIDSKETEIVIMPFTDRVHSKKEFLVDDLQGIIEYINALEVLKGDTNIADAWQAGVKEINTERMNYLFLLTDGIHNTGPDKEILYDRLKEWKKLSENKYYFGFYVMLTKISEDKELEMAIKDTSQLFILKSANVNITFLTTNYGWKTNIKNNKRVKIQYKKNTSKRFAYDLQIKATLNNNPYYRIKSVENNLKEDLSIVLEIEELLPLKDLPIETDLTFELEYEKEKYPLLFVIPEKVKLKIQNRGIRSVSIKEKGK